MKITLITFPYALNYGAVLQTWALKKTLERMGHTVRISSYATEKEANQYKRKLENPLPFKDVVRKGRGIRTWMKNEYCNLISRKAWNRKWKCFRDFTLHELGVDTEHTTTDVAATYAIPTDLFVCGSDQIWNWNITSGCDPIYYAYGSGEAKKVAYAASMGNVRMPPESIRSDFETYIRGMDHISVREEHLATFLEKEFALDNVEVCVDPTLLVSAEEYRKLSSNATKRYDGKFVFAFFYGASEVIEDSKKQISRITGLPCIESNWLTFHKKGNQRNDLSVEEFLWFIDNAEYVITDSFHCTVFSLLFHKNFFCVSPMHYNQRVKGLLERIGLPNRMALGPEGINTDRISGWENVENALCNERRSSMEFLEKATRE